ncbi:MAG: T9SS type A sorting domain-containing protein [Bacteroidia bacterium]|nr:T9SS type A sorting domain-containing protein [Bacteroidia bacterium]
MFIVSGRVVKCVYAQHKDSEKINVTGLPDGLYILNIFSGSKQIVSEKVIIQK